MKRCLSLLLLLTPGAGAAQDEGYVDFSNRMTPVCEVVGLSVAPPAGWINVPIDAADEEIEGCQMMLIEDEALIGILRLLSVEVPDDTDAQQMLVGIEAQAVSAMNYRLGDPLWRRDDVPVKGLDGFGGGKAIGVALSLPGNPRALEGHFLTFHGPDVHYVLTLLTPAKSVDEGSHYEKLTRGMATVMRTLQPRAGGPEN